ncbi:MAG: DUF4124 domain-containing protein [Pseudoxanthomonas sp.]
MKLQYLLLMLMLATADACAEEVVFYRCTDASGALTLQNMPCPKGQAQQKKVMQSVNTVPMGTTSTPSPGRAAAPAAVTTPPAVAYTPAPATSSPPADPRVLTSDPAPEVAVIADADRLTPPVLFQCITYDKDSYITEDEEPQSRCVALRTVGLDGNPQGGAGEACEMMRDTCARVADGALCDAWKKRLGETEVAWRFARPGNERKNKEEFERTRKIWNQSTCSK